MAALPKVRRRGAKKGAARGRRRIPRPVRRGGIIEHASCRVTQTFSLMNSNQLYTNYNTQLSLFARAVTIAEGYQLYRIKRITYKFSPLADTFAPGAGVSVPYLYIMMDRMRQLSTAATTGALRNLGAKPRRLDDKIVTFSYRPSVQTGTYDSLPPLGQGNTQFTQYKVSPWLSCRDQENGLVWVPDTTDHLGCVWILENSGGANVQYKCERIVEFEFKKPAYTVVAGANDPPAIDVEDITA